MFAALAPAIKLGGVDVVISKIYQWIVAGVALIAICGVALYVAYTRGYQSAQIKCEKEKADTAIVSHTIKDDIINENRKKTAEERRKALQRYVIR